MKPETNRPTALIVNHAMNPSGRLQMAWREGDRISVEEFLSHHGSLELTTQGLFDLVLTEIQLKSEYGLNVNRTHYINRFSKLKKQLEDYFLARPTNPQAKAVTVSIVDSKTPHIPGYELLQEIGRGGMGVVYKATQTSLNRPVALKVILSGSFASKEDHERFRREVEAIATLKNPAIVQVYQVGETNGFPFCALEYIDGGNLAELIRKGKLPPKHAATLAKKIALGAHHAHENGIVHRDLKPANVLLQVEDNELQPKITDFGIAKRMLDDSNLTGTGMAAGTPQYMAPEQALANKEIPVGPAADVYAIGVILYEMLTKEVPFDAQSPMEVMKRVVSEAPRPLTKISRNVPRDLETICLKCLEKEAHNRYPSALALASDLERYLQGVPVKARRIHSAEAAWRWCRRNSLVAGLVMGLFLVLTLGTLFASYWAIQANANAKKADQALIDQKEANAEANTQTAIANAATLLANQQKQAAEDAKKQADRDKNLANSEAEKARNAEADAKQKQLALNEAKAKLEAEIYQVRMNVAHTELASGQVTIAQKLLEMYTDPQPDDPRSFEWHYLNSQLRNRKIELYPTFDPQGVIPTSQSVISYNQTGVWLAHSDFWGFEPLYQIRNGNIHAVAISPNQKLLAISSYSPGDLAGKIELFSLAEKRILKMLKLENLHPQQLATGLAFGSDEVLFASIGSPQPMNSPQGRILGFNTETGKVVADLGSRGNLCELKQTATRPENELKAIPTQSPECSARPSQQAASAGSVFEPLRILVNMGEKSRFTPGFVSSVNAVAVVGGKWVVGGDQFGMLLGFDIQTGEMSHNFGNSIMTRLEVVSLAGSSQRPLLAVGCPEGRYFVWNLSYSEMQYSSTTEHTDIVKSLAFSPSGEFLATGSASGVIHIVETYRYKTIHKQPAHKSGINGLAYSGNNKWLFSIDKNAQFGVWDPMDNPFGGVVGFAAENSIVFSPRKGHCFVSSQNRIASIYENNKHELSKDIPYRDEDQITNLFTANRVTGAIARSTKNGTIDIWEYDSKKHEYRKPYRLVRANGIPCSLEFIPSKNWLAIGYLNGAVQFVELGEGLENRKMKVIENLGRAVHKMAFSPDGETGAFLVGDKLELYTIHRQHLKTLPLDKFAPFEIRFSPDGKSLGVCGIDLHKFQGRFQEFDLATGKPSLSIEMHKNKTGCFAYSPDGARIVTGGDDCCVRLWDRKSGRLMLTLTGHPRHVDAVEFVEDGQMIYSVGGGEIRRWDAGVSYIKERHLQALRSVRLSDVKTTILEDGQVVLEAKLTNASKKPILLRESDTSFMSMMVTYDANPVGGPVRFLPMFWGDQHLQRSEPLRPNESIPLKITLEVVRIRPKGPLRAEVLFRWTDQSEVPGRETKFEVNPPRPPDAIDPK